MNSVLLPKNLHGRIRLNNVIERNSMHRTVFISSTFQDLQTHRKAVWNVLGNFNVAIRGMERFGARKESPLETCLFELEQCDLYVGIIAFRHGSVEPKSEKSYTQIEYERAVQLGKEVLIYLIDEENAQMPIRFIDRGQGRDKLEAFKVTLRERHTVDTFLDEQDLAAKLRRDLSRTLQVRAGATTSSRSDEFEAAQSVLSQFLLLPKSVSGSDIRVKLRATGKAYPASRAACKEFNLAFGATIGIPVSIVAPSLVHGGEAFDLFVDQKLSTGLLRVDKGDAIDCYVQLHFAETEIDELQARFRTRTFHTGGAFAQFALGKEFGEVVTRKADSAVAMEMSRCLSIEKTANPATSLSGES